MRCSSCGREVSDEPFCEWCGKPLKTESPTPSKLESVTPSASQPSSPVHEPTPSFGLKGTPKNASSSPRWHGIVWAVLAIVLYLAIADAAVETFLRDSPLRWWIAGAAVLYLALCAAVWRLIPKLWRRLNWASQAGLSLLVLLALMSATAWVPGGLDQGLTLLGQPTSIVLALVSAVVVALSGVFLARLHFVPLAGKIVAGLLAAYAVAAFLLAVIAGTPYPSLFHGASQWTRLPSWLQGATVGGLFLVPLALLLEIVTGLRRITRDKISDFAFKVIALAMSLVITAAAIRMPADATMGSAAGYDSDAMEPPPWLSTSSEKLPEGEAGYKVVSERLNRMYTALDVVSSKIDRSLFEIDALADRLGSDPATIFHFVRDEIRYEPYTGVLRGALGTLLCRAGNSLDRSLLLAAVLQKAGLTTQIASGHLSSQQAQTLVNRLFEPVKPVPQAVPTIAELAPEVGRAMGVDQAKLLQLSDEMQKYGQRQNKQLMDYVDHESSYLSNLLSKAGVDAGVITPNDQLLAEASEHYWVQYQNAGGQWVDLDSSFADAEPRKAIASATNTFAPDAVPEELYHHLRITLTLRVAQVAGGENASTTDTVLLDQELRASDQQGREITLANFPIPAPDLEKSGGDFANMFAGTKGYQTILQLGSQVIPGKYFDVDGRISDDLGGPVGDVVTNAGGIGRGIGGIAGGVNGAFGGAPSEGSGTRIVGEWVDYQVTAPGLQGKSLFVRGVHRDIVTPTTVTSSAAASPQNPPLTNTTLTRENARREFIWFAELLPITGATIPDYAGYLGLKSLSTGRSLAGPLLRKAFGLRDEQAEDGATAHTGLPVTNVLLATAASEIWNLPSSHRFSSLRSYFEHLGLIVRETWVNPSRDLPSLKESYDIAAFGPRVVADPNLKPGDARERAAFLHVFQGVWATRIEWALHRPNALHSRDASGKSNFNTTEVFKVAQDKGIPVIVLKSDTESLDRLAAFSVPPPIKAELATDLKGGRTLVVPSSPSDLEGRSQFAWWRLDNSSGEFIGVMPGGRGQDMAEYQAIVRKAAIEAVLCSIAFSDKEDPEDRAMGGFVCLVSGSILGTGELMSAGYYEGALIKEGGSIVTYLGYFSLAIAAAGALSPTKN